MQVTEYTHGPDEVAIVAALCADDTVCARIAARWDANHGGPLAGKAANLIGAWAVKYHRAYGKAPGTAIRGMFEQWAADPRTHKDNAAMVERLLAQASESYAAAPTSPEYVVDLAGRHFNRVKLQRLQDALAGHLAGGDVDGALAAVGGFNRVELGAGAGVDVFLDEAAARQAHAAATTPLFTYPGALGRLLNPAFVRSAFVQLVAPTGRGKTWWMMDFAWQAMLARNRVAFFVVGDMSQAEMEMRFQSRATGKPDKLDPYNYPRKISRAKDEFYAVVESDRQTPASIFTAAEGWAALDRVQKREVKSKESYLRLSVHASNSISAEGLIGVVEGWRHAGWGSPDVCVIDYPDNLEPPSGIKDKRDQINLTWKTLRGWAQTLDAAVIIATQSDAKGYNVITLKADNFSEARYKRDHVTAEIGLNQTPTEKPQGIYRLNLTKLRGGKFDERRCVHVASCLAVGNPAVLSCY